MVPSPFSSEEPCFPDTLFWLLENQCRDGSWARPHHHSRLKKDVLSSTLACIIALKKWGVGQQHINRGLDFLELNFASTKDESQISPIGFDIIFPTMLDHAKGLSLNLNLEKTMLRDMINIRDLELKRCYERESRDMEDYLAYIGEGMGELQDWESVVMKYQRKNGSLFNSPSTTAAAFMALGNSNCLKYLNLLVNKFGSAVPAVYPLNIYSQLCTIDNLERLGINRHFAMEIQSVLDQTYRCWVEGDEEIFMDAATCALAFRILRMNGYNVTSDPITKIIEEWFSFSSGNKRDINTTLELYKASQLTLYRHEKELEKQTPKLRLLLEQQLSSRSIQSPQLNAEVKQALIYPFYATLKRIAKRKAIEHYNFDNTRMLKTSYSLANLGNKDFHLLSLEDYKQCQAIHSEEFREFGRWFVESRLNEVEIEVHRFEYCYLTAAATLFSPDDADARMSWAKNAFLVTLIDDFFDSSSKSIEDMKKLIHLVEFYRWDEDISTEGCSRDVEIFFSALKAVICEDAEKGSKLQGRSIRSHLINIWLDMLYAFMKEVEWRVNKYVPTLEEYMSNGYVSFGMGPIVLQPLYLVGPIVSKEMVSHPDYHNLFKSLSTYGRLINDIRGYEREMEEGKVCAVPLYIAKNGGKVSVEDVIWEITSLIERERRELMRLVLEKKSTIPRACRDLFWNMWSVLHLFYNKDDGCRSDQLIQLLDHTIHQPIYVYPSSSPPTLTAKQTVT